MATTTTKKLTGVDKGFFHCESEDHLMTVASCSIFHEDITTEEITNSLQNMANQFPKFRQKVSKIKNERYWESYNFQIDQHVHEISLPSASTPCEGTINQNHAELRETLSELMSLPLNEDIALWECHIIRIHSNRTAMFVRVHHAITDGQGAIRCLLSTTGNKDPSLQYGKHSQQATLTQNLTSSWKQSLMKIFQVLAVLFQVFWGLVTLLYHFWMIFLFLDRKHFKGKLTTDKIVSFTDDVDLNMVKDIKNHFNVSVNDVLVASLAGSFRDYLLETEGEIKDDNLLTYIPVSMRDPDDWELGNKVAIVFAKLPLTIEDPIERLMEVHKRMDIIKKSKEPLVSYFATELLGNSPLSDTAVGKWALQHLLKKPHAVFTNVPGPRIPLNYAGKTISSFFPFVPQPGEGGLGVALLSYANKVSCSLIADRSLLGDHGGITITNGLNKHVHNLQSLLPSAKLE